MEHLATFADAPHGTRPRYICTESYDNLEWTIHPERHDWDKKVLFSLSFIKACKPRLAAFLQTLLFFGLISTTLDITIDKDDFVCTTENGTHYITTASLPALIQHWKMHVDSWDEKDKETRLEEVQAILLETAEFVQRCCTVWTIAPRTGATY